MKHHDVTHVKLLFSLNNIVINLLTEISLQDMTHDNSPRSFKHKKKKTVLTSCLIFHCSLDSQLILLQKYDTFLGQKSP